MRLFLIISLSALCSSWARADCPKVKAVQEFPIFRPKLLNAANGDLSEKLSVEISGIPLTVHYPADWQARYNSEDGEIRVEPKIPICMDLEHVMPNGEAAKDCLGTKITILQHDTPDRIANSISKKYSLPHKTWKEGKATVEWINKRDSSFHELKGFERSQYLRMKNNCTVSAGSYFLVKEMTLEIDYAYVSLGKNNFSKETATLFEVLKSIEVGTK